MGEGRMVRNRPMALSHGDLCIRLRTNHIHLPAKYLQVLECIVMYSGVE